MRISSVFFILLVLRTGYPDQGFSAQPDQRSLAISWFNHGQFDKALPVFSALTYNYPSELLLKYYHGACLIETENYVSESEKNLILASTGEVPARVYYYLGRYYHATGNWNNAQRFYNRFKNYSTPSEIGELGIEELSRLCYSQVNPFAPVKAGNQTTAESPFDPITKDKSSLSDRLEVLSGQEPVNAQDTLLKNGKDSAAIALLPEIEPAVGVAEDQGENTGQLSDSATETKPVAVILPAFIEFQITDKVTYITEEMFHRVEARYEYQTAAGKEKQLDSLLKEVKQLRKQYHNSVKPVVRDSLAIMIQNLEYRNLVMNTETDQHYNQARRLEQEWWKEADERDYQSYNQIKDSLNRLRYVPPVIPLIVPPADTLQADSVSAVDVTEVEPPEQDVDAGNGITYKIQIGAFDKGISKQRKEQFEKLEKIRTIETYVNDEGATVYTTGNLKNFRDAVKLQTQVRQEGIKDAFVIAIKNGKRIPLPAEK